MKVRPSRLTSLGDDDLTAVITTVAELDRRRAAGRLAALALVAATALGGCGDEDPGTSGLPPEPTSPAARPDATFAADLEVTADAVRVRYSLANSSDQPLTVLNRVPSGTSGAAVDYDGTAAWVTGAGDNQIVLSQQVFAKPDAEGKNWETTPVTGASTLAGGATLDGEVAVPRPFVRSHPYGDDVGHGQITLPDDPETVRFCLGVIATPLVGGDTRELGDDGLLVVNDDSTYERQYLYCSDPAPLT